MSLRTKATLLFAVSAVLPMLLVGLLGYAHWGRALASLLEGRTAELATSAAAELDHSLRSRRATVKQLARSEGVLKILQEARRPNRLRPGETANAWLRQVLVHDAWAAGVELRDSRGRLVATEGALAPGRCVEGRQEFIPLEEAVQDSETGGLLGTVTVYSRFAALFSSQLATSRPGTAGYLLVQDRSTGRIFQHRDCAALVASNAVAPPPRRIERLASGREPAERGSVYLLPAPEAEPRERRSVRLRAGDTELVASIAPLDFAPWIVVSAAAPGDVISTYVQNRRMYLYQTLVIAVAALFAFIWALRSVLRPLTLLARAADEVGAGNFTPWSPVPVGDDEVSRLTMAFQRMARELRELIREVEVTRPLAAIGQFAARLSHEFRNPLSSIHLNLRRIDSAVQRGRAPAELGQAAALALGEIRRLGHLLDNALALGRSHDPIGQRFHVHQAVLQETLVLLDAELRARGASIDVERDARADAVVGDADAIQGVLVHLIRNAMDAMPDGGRIRMRSTNDGTGRKIRVHVRDEGPGIPPALRDRVFAPFFTTKSTGTGLGLTTALAAVRAYGGRLYLETRSELEPGAEFVVELPLAPDNGGGPSPPEGNR